jgi:hypothetical protein
MVSVAVACLNFMNAADLSSVCQVFEPISALHGASCARCRILPVVFDLVLYRENGMHIST